MSTLSTALYQRLHLCGRPEVEAKAAVQAVAEYDSRFNCIDSDLALVKAGLIR
jgi:hypothetical protein